MGDVFYVALALVGLAALVMLIARLAAQTAATKAMPAELARLLEEKHRAMLTDPHGGLAQQCDRLSSRLSGGLTETRETRHRPELTLAGTLGATTDKRRATR